MTYRFGTILYIPILDLSMIPVYHYEHISSNGINEKNYWQLTVFCIHNHGLRKYFLSFTLFFHYYSYAIHCRHSSRSFCTSLLAILFHTVHLLGSASASSIIWSRKSLLITWLMITARWLSTPRTPSLNNVALINSFLIICSYYVLAFAMTQK